MSGSGFLGVPEQTAGARELFDEDLAELGYVTNASRLWAYQPATQVALFDLLHSCTAAHPLSVRERGILVTACAASLGDSYCALAWGRRLANEADGPTAAGVLRGEDSGLSTRERALARWARKVAADPSGTTAADVRDLRDAGYGDAEIFGITVYVALRVAFATVNDALGARPDAQFRTTAPPAVLGAVTFGRQIADET